MFQLAKRLDKNTVSVFSVHPGFVKTNILNYETTFFNDLMTRAAVGMGKMFDFVIHESGRRTCVRKCCVMFVYFSLYLILCVVSMCW